MTKAVVMMTALLPTTGHIDLIKFACGIADEVDVIVSTRSFEPAIVADRVNWLDNEFTDYGWSIRFYEHKCDDAPQNPEDHPDFWNWWKKVVEGYSRHVDYFVASEKYGHEMAKALNCQFVPYDVNRKINPAVGTEVREHLFWYWKDALPKTVQSELVTTITLFGQESVGKSTIAKSLAQAQSMYLQAYPEYARPYLEEVGSELTIEKMKMIAKGQQALQWLAIERATKPIAMFDTDLFSTVGYYKLHPEFLSDNYESLVTEAKLAKSELYFILPDDVPFEVDPLRYGGDKRESTRQFWIDIAEDFRLNYLLVPEGSLYSKIDFITKSMFAHLENKFKELREFQRT